ncbi:MAG: indolepyruvate oxidoreductase subunit beta [Halanaerobiaceae bacterium]
MSNINIMIVGVGGQGSLLASRVIGNIALNHSYEVKMSEVHGMAQRGGSVVTGVKFGNKVYSPIVEKMEADIILALEKMEGLRWSNYLKPEGKLFINTQKIDPMPVITGNEEYPENIIGFLQEKYNNIYPVDALEKAKASGSMKTVNTVMLGLMAQYMEFEKNNWLKVIEKEVPQKYVEINHKAFKLGYNHN